MSTNTPYLKLFDPKPSKMLFLERLINRNLWLELKIDDISRRALVVSVVTGDIAEIFVIVVIGVSHWCQSLVSFIVVTHWRHSCHGCHWCRWCQSLLSTIGVTGVIGVSGVPGVTVVVGIIGVTGLMTPMTTMAPISNCCHCCHWCHWHH